MNFVNSNPPMPTAAKAKGRILPNFMDLSFCLILSSFLNNIPPSKTRAVGWPTARVLCKQAINALYNSREYYFSAMYIVHIPNVKRRHRTEAKPAFCNIPSITSP